MASRLAHSLRTLAASAIGAATITACRGLLGIDALPDDTTTDAGHVTDAADTSESSSAEGGPKAIDPGWAYWRIAPDVSPTNFEVGNGINHDLVTGLDWQRSTEDPLVWSDARAACEKLELDGRKGFRLPTRIELLSIMDFAPAAEGNPFPDTFKDPDWNCYWTLSGETDRQTHWLLAAQYAQLVISNRNDTHCVSRCVGGGPPYDYEVNIPPDYVIGKGSFRDPLTRLEWQAYTSEAAKQLVTLDDAEQRCSDLVLDSEDDWHLPTVKELETLVNERRNQPSLDVRIDGEKSFYWSSTAHSPTEESDGGLGRLAWRVSFTDGTMTPSDDPETGIPAGKALTRCVRDY